MFYDSHQDLEKDVVLELILSGWAIHKNKKKKKKRPYDMIATQDRKQVAIQVKNSWVPIRVSHIEQFQSFLESKDGLIYDCGWLISSSEFSNQALAYYNDQCNSRLRLATAKKGKVEWLPLPGEADLAQQEKRPLYIGVFTCKGGVGKTTISAHLAGAMALTGYDVALVDLDPQKNLSMLLGDGVVVGGMDQNTRTIGVFNHNEWKQLYPRDQIRAVVCDFSPSFEANPVELINEVDYCIIPTTLNPLGLNKNGHVIRETLEKIRSMNTKAQLFVLINNYNREETEKRDILTDAYNQYFSEFFQNDDQFEFLNPETVSIRSSSQLFYWGFHVFQNQEPRLAFNPPGAKCDVKTDFLNLLNYIEERSNMPEYKKRLDKNPQAASSEEQSWLPS